MENQDELSIDNREHHSHWNEESIDSNIPPLCPADNWRESSVNGTEPSQAKSQHGRYYKRYDPDKDRYCMKKMLPSFFVPQLLEVEWCTDGKEGVANLYGGPYGQWINNETRYNAYEIENHNIYSWSTVITY